MLSRLGGDPLAGGARTRIALLPAACCLLPSNLHFAFCIAGYPLAGVPAACCLFDGAAVAERLERGPVERIRPGSLHGQHGGAQGAVLWLSGAQALVQTYHEGLCRAV